MHTEVVYGGQRRCKQGLLRYIYIIDEGIVFRIDGIFIEQWLKITNSNSTINKDKCCEL